MKMYTSHVSYFHCFVTSISLWHSDLAVCIVLVLISTTSFFFTPLPAVSTVLKLFECLDAAALDGVDAASVAFEVKNR
jgi:hypothetical protein